MNGLTGQSNSKPRAARRSGIQSGARAFCHECNWSGCNWLGKGAWAEAAKELASHKEGPEHAGLSRFKSEAV